MSNIVNVRASLEPRDSDIHLSPKHYLRLSLFAGLRRPPSLQKFPGAVVVRRYHKGEELFRQGEAGWTAFYILSPEDVLQIKQARLEAMGQANEKIALQMEINRLREEAQRRETVPPEDPSLRAATVYMATLRQNYNPKAGMRRMLNFTSRPSGAIKNRDQQTIYVPVGGPQTISYESGRAPLFEGDLFGEMSCMFRTPRSATVVVDRDCYMLEFLRHVLEAVHRDPVYKARTDAIYMRRVLELQVRKMPLFADLTKEEFEEIRNNVELVSFEPGQIICDEHERSDCMYLVRQGLVRVMKNVSHLVGPQDVTDWGSFARGLRQGESVPPGTPAGKLWALLPEGARALLRNPEPEKTAPAERAEVLYAVNEVLKDRCVIDAPEFKPVTAGEGFESMLRATPPKKQDWTDAQVRAHNRLLLEALCPVGLRRHRRSAGVETILWYNSVNEHFGEIGLMLGQPRAATCLAYGHPNHEGTVELVKIPAPTFWKLVKMSPVIRDRIKQLIAERRRQMIAQLARPVWAEANQVQFSDRFAELGLIQGQKLMLIDLDRCTRCDECVKACVNNHDDGRTRLFLDGPRFGRYLVPVTCRSCLDPVCMIPCPVSSIVRGDNKEIVIKDWCIGCGACADACPYGSIQMHDLGRIPEAARGWRWLPAGVKGTEGDWTRPGFRDAAWRVGQGPFTWSRELQDQLRQVLPDAGGFDALAARPLLFRHEFDLDRRAFPPESRYKVELISMGSDVHVWVNGVELPLDDRVKRGRHEYTIPTPAKEKPGETKTDTQPAARPLSDFLRPGRNVIAARVTPSCKPNEVLLQLRLDPIKRPEKMPAEIEESVADEVVEKMVTHRAVVCDMCSSGPGQIPACVHACPHDAAMRIDARTNFPTR